MKRWRINYYRTKNWIDCKVLDAKNAEEAIKKARVKHISDLYEVPSSTPLRPAKGKPVVKEKRASTAILEF